MALWVSGLNGFVPHNHQQLYYHTIDRRPLAMRRNNNTQNEAIGKNSNTENEHPPLVLTLRSHLKHAKEETNEKNAIQLILASQSPRRREILDMMGLGDRYIVQVSPLDEESLATQLSKEDPITYTQTLANAKARAVHGPPNSIVLASDTIVSLDDCILEKPESTDDAIRMLRSLQGRSHTVHTGVCVMTVDHTGDIRSTDSFVSTANVNFAPLSLADIKAYVDTGDPMDKAGSYGIQGIGGALVESIQGDFYTVRVGY